MSEPKLEARVKELESQLALMNTQLTKLNTQVTKLNDIEEIQRLQRSYGYYIQNWMYAEMSDLFADSPEAELNLLAGVYCGKENIKKYFYSSKDSMNNPDFLHQLMQLSGIVDVMPDGKTAKGRWFAYGALAVHRGEGIQALACNGIYVADYVKENGIWKILKLVWNPLIMISPLESWVKGKKADIGVTPPPIIPKVKPDKMREINCRYPSGYIVPFHFKHPVTGKESDVTQHNSAMKSKPLTL
jgi:uncharacterized coiled-coil protein SlyX